MRRSQRFAHRHRHHHDHDRRNLLGGPPVRSLTVAVMKCCDKSRSMRLNDDRDDDDDDYLYARERSFGLICIRLCG